MAEKDLEEFTPMFEKEPIEGELTEEELAIKKLKEEEEALEKAWVQSAEQEAVGHLIDNALLEDRPKTNEAEDKPETDESEDELEEEELEEEEQGISGVGNMDNAFNVEGKTADSMNSEDVFKLYLHIAQEEDSQIENVDHDPETKMVTVDMASGTKIVDTGDLIGVDAPKDKKPSDKDIETLVKGVKNRNWRGMQLEGSEEFKARVWLEAQRQGVRTIGYRPPDEVRAIWEAEKPPHKVEKEIPEEEKQEEVKKPKEEEKEQVLLKKGQRPIALLPEKAESLQKQEKQEEQNVGWEEPKQLNVGREEPKQLNVGREEPKQLNVGFDTPKQLKAGQETSLAAQETDVTLSLKQFEDCMVRSFEGESTDKDKVFITEFLNNVEKMPEDIKEDTQSQMRSSVKKLLEKNGALYQGTETEQQNAVIQQSMSLLQNMFKENPVDIKAKTQENLAKTQKKEEQEKPNLALELVKRNQRGS